MGATNFNRTTDPPALCLSARSLGELVQWLRRCRPGLSEFQIQGAEPHREHLPPSVNGQLCRDPAVGVRNGEEA